MHFHDIFFGSVVTKFALGTIAILAAKLLPAVVMKRLPAGPKAIIAIYVVTTFIGILIFQLRFVAASGYTQLARQRR